MGKSKELLWAAGPSLKRAISAIFVYLISVVIIAIASAFFFEFKFYDILDLLFFFLFPLIFFWLLVIEPSMLKRVKIYNEGIKSPAYKVVELFKGGEYIIPFRRIEAIRDDFSSYPFDYKENTLFLWKTDGIAICFQGRWYRFDPKYLPPEVFKKTMYDAVGEKRFDELFEGDEVTNFSPKITKRMESSLQFKPFHFGYRLIGITLFSMILSIIWGHKQVF